MWSEWKFTNTLGFVVLLRNVPNTCQMTTVCILTGGWWTVWTHLRKLPSSLPNWVKGPLQSEMLGGEPRKAPLQPFPFYPLPGSRQTEERDRLGFHYFAQISCPTAGNHGQRKPQWLLCHCLRGGRKALPKASYQVIKICNYNVRLWEEGFTSLLLWLWGISSGVQPLLVWGLGREELVLYTGVQVVYSKPIESKELLEKGNNVQCTFSSSSADGRLIHGVPHDLRTNTNPKVERALDYMWNLWERESQGWNRDINFPLPSGNELEFQISFTTTRIPLPNTGPVI